MNKFYINITNHCQYECPFCCMYSSPFKERFMDFNTFKSIVDIANGITEVQLEGGEPLTHPLLYLFLEYCASLEYIQKITIDTNGDCLHNFINKIIEIASRTKKHITIKPSINTYLISKRKNMIDTYEDIASSCEFLDYVDFNFNIRYTNDYDKEKLLTHLENFVNKKYINYTLFQMNSYGRATKMKELPDITINPIYEVWSIWSSDGKCFDKDLVKRSEHENI